MNRLNAKNRITWIDSAKGFGIILVVLGHIGFGRLQTWFYSFHMPLFFFLSGYVFKVNCSFPKFLKSKVRTILVPYIVFVIIFIFYLFSKKDLCEYISYMIIQKRYYHLWFLTSLFLVQLLYYPVIRVSRESDLKMVIFTALFVVVWYLIGKSILPWNIDASLYASPYFLAGYLFKKHSLGSMLTFKRSAALLPVFLLLNIGLIMLSLKISGTGLEIFTADYGLSIITYFAALFGIAFAICFSFLTDSNVLRYIGVNSIIYFGIHPFTISWAKSILNYFNYYEGTGISGAVFKLIWVALILVINTVIVFLYNIIKNNIKKCMLKTEYSSN